MRVGSVGTKSRASGGAGFTITELLVVMAIIGILAAIMFPVVVKAKESARVARCLSNLRQLGTGLTMYMDSYDARFPAAASWGSPDYWRQFPFGSQATIQELLSPFVRNQMSAGTKDKDGHRLYRTNSVFVCPSDVGVPGKTTIYGCPPNVPIAKYAGCSYEYYASNQIDWQTYDPDVPATAKIQSWTGLSPEVRVTGNYGRIGAPMSKIMSPTRKAVMGDLWYWHMGDKPPEYGADYKADESALQGRLAYRNTLFADGHAQRVTGQDHELARLQRLTAGWHNMSEVPEY